MLYDYIIIGSGFGGSVSAMRLSEKGYRVAVLEKGKRYRAQDFAKTNWNLRKYLWMPLIRCFGIQNITFTKQALILSGVGVGGGSLVYANTLMQPAEPLQDWQKDLVPFYSVAKKMLGVVQNPHLSEPDEILKKVAGDLKCESTFHPVQVGVYFGDEKKDPYFDGQGPIREPCTLCGGCMVGCRYNAKNTLDKNYLYFAEKNGAQIFSETEVLNISVVNEGYEFVTRSSTALWPFQKKKKWLAKKVVLAGGVLGTVPLLLKCRDVYKTLPDLSQELGKTIRTNGESLMGSTTLDSSKDFSKGIAISSAIHPDVITKIEIVRYSRGSDFMRLLSLPFVSVRQWASQTIILLVMQTVDNQMGFKVMRPWYRLFRKSVVSFSVKCIPAYIEVAHKAVKLVSDKIKGISQNSFSEKLFNIPATAHILGGAKIGANASEGVVNKNLEVFNYPGLYVVDGSVIPTNLGVNPSLTITALAEQAMSKISSYKPQ